MKKLTGKRTVEKERSRLTVIVDLFVCRKTQTGTCTYAEELWRALEDAGNQWGAVRIVPLRGPRLCQSRMFLARVFNFLVDIGWYQVWLPFYAWVLRADVVHYTANCGSLWGRHQQLVTVHDTLFLDSRTDFGGLFRLYTRLLWVPTIRRADAVVTVSQHSAKAIQEQLHRTSYVVWNGPGNSQLWGAPVRQALPSEAPYFLYVGMVAAHKNLGVLLKALTRVRCKHPTVRLVLAGGTGRNRDGSRSTMEMNIAEQGLGEAVTLTGYISTPQLAMWIRGAQALMLPSFHEGFGFTPLEALRLGVPVVVSGIPVMREILGEGALYADPDNPEQWVEHMEHLLEPQFRTMRVVVGRQITGRYSWESTAQQYLQIYQRMGEKS